MDTLEKVFVDQLKETFEVSTLNPELQKFLQELSRQQKSDFTPTEGFFSNENKEAIARKGAEQLSAALQAYGPQAGISEAQAAWQKIVGDFHRSGYWGFLTQKQKPPKVLSEEQKRTRELFPYIWTAFQALIVMKLVISYFGIESADSDETPWLLYLAIAFSFGSLAFFAWRKYKKGE